METFKLGESILWRRHRVGIYRLLDLEILPIARFLKPKGNVVFDVGGNIGLWSIALAEAFPDRVASLDVFEPSPAAMAVAEQFQNEGFFSVLGDNIRFHNAAVGAAAGRGILYFDKAELALSSLASSKSQLPQREVNLTESVEVSIITIDEFCRNKNIGRVDYMKVDTEGFEMDVMQGSIELLKQKAIGAICFEFGLNHIQRRQFFKDFWDFFALLNYNLHWLKRGENGFDLLPIKEYTTRWENFQFNRYFVASAS